MMKNCKKFIYCDDVKDTKILLDIFLKCKKVCKVLAVVHFDRETHMKFRVETLKYPTQAERENQELFYRKEEAPEIVEWEHCFKNKDIMFIVYGNEEKMTDVYDMFGLDEMAANALVEMKKLNHIMKEKDWTVGNRIDSNGAIPIMKMLYAIKYFTEKEREVIEKAKIFDWSGATEI